MEMIVRIKVLKQLRNLALVLDEERLEDAELGALHLPHHKPVDEVVGVEGYEQRSTIVAVGIHSAVVRDDSTLGLGEIVEVKHRLIGSRIEVDILTQTTVETIGGNTYALAHDGSGEGERRKVALGTTDELLAKKCQVFDR